MYDLLARKGDRYAVLANGVVRGDTIAGVAAINYMKSVAADAGTPMGEAQVDAVRLGMAHAYLSALNANVVAGVVKGPLPQTDIARFHREVFVGNGYPESAWTLHSVFMAMPQASHQTYWEQVLSSAGDLRKEVELSARTHYLMGQSSVMGPSTVRAAARDWIRRVESPSGWRELGEAGMNSLFKPILRDMPVPVESSSPSSPIKIDITPTTESRRNLQGQDDIRNDVSAGYVTRRLTHSIAFTDKTLDNTDFTSAQMGSLATGGIRPGELQRDPNVRPNQHLAQFYKEGADKPDFSLRNAAVLNGLAAMTTVNTYVDPLLFDLSGKGAGMTGLDDAVLFDVDNSGSLHRTGWADRQTGMLVHDDGSGQINRISQLFSEYYAGKPGTDGAPGETPFKDGFAALASVDANADGAITPADPAWGALRLWVDGNHDGRADQGELRTLAEHGITQVSLGGVKPLGEVRQSNEVIARGTFLGNGVQREVLAVRFLADTVSNLVEGQKDAAMLTSTSGETSRRAYVHQGGLDATLDAGVLKVDTLHGGVGNDTLKAAPDGSWLVGGGGSNTYVGGPGDDVFVISASDDPANVRGNGGRDTALIVGEQGVGLNLAEAGLTIAQGGRGKDIIVSGGQRGVFIKGGAGDSLLIGGGGNDVLAGGSGRNTLLGGTGKSVIYAGPSGDYIYASAAGSIIHAGRGADHIMGGAADDVIEAGRGNAIIDGAGGVNLVTLHGNHDEYLITRTKTGYTIVDRVKERDGDLTLSNVQKLSFADVAAIDLVAPRAVPIGDLLAPAQLTPFRTQGAALVLPASALLANDLPLASSGPLRIASVGDAKGATVVLTAQGDVQVTPSAGHDGDISFRYDLVDAAGNASIAVTEIGSSASAPLRATVILRHAQSPNDPLAFRQWYLEDIDVLPVWRDFTGKGIRIGQFEPGGEFAVAPEIFDVQHPDLKVNIDPVWLATQRSSGTLPALASNHATQVAGVMVAARNDQGGIGIAHEATLGGHYLANKGDDLTSLGQMVNYDVANNSWGFKTDFAIGNVQEGRIDTALALAFTSTLAATNGRGGLGTIVVASGGNQREKGGSAQGSLISNSRHAIEVAAINAKADLSVLQVASVPFSNPGASLLVAAPGSHVLSSGIDLEAERGAKIGSAYGTTQGTSFAAPIVSGVAALMLQANPGLGYRDVQQILALSARKVEDPTTAWADNAARNWNGASMHVSHDYGFGLIDARAAVRLAESWPGQANAANERQLSASSESQARQLLAGQTLTLSLPMPGDVRVEHAEVDIHASVGRLGDLTLTLVSPGGTRSVLLDRTGKAPGSAADVPGDLRSGVFKYAFMSTHHRAEPSEGDWHLEIRNASKGLPLTIDRWSLRLAGSPVSENDVYYYTDEYAASLSGNPGRSVLDDAVNGKPGGRNTLNAAAVRRGVSLNLTSGVGQIAGAALTIAPGSVHNLISGDGDDTLVAGPDAALLDGGRGNNLLRGGAGTDRFVIHQRAAGSDLIEGFEATREVLDLIGFGNRTFTDLTLYQDGPAVVLDLGKGQTVRWGQAKLGSLQASNFRFLGSVEAAPGYLSGNPEGEKPKAANAPIVLAGGAKGVSLTSDETGRMVATLAGTVHKPAGVAPSVFQLAHQEGVTDYGNALRGFRHGIDKIDLTQIGISRFEDLQISKQQRFQLNGFAQIHGVSVETKALPGQDGAVKLLYLDALEVAQVTADDFVFAKPAVVTAGDQEIASANLMQLHASTLAVETMHPASVAEGGPSTVAPLPNLANLVEAMAAFIPQPGSAPLALQAPAQPWESTLAVAA